MAHRISLFLLLFTTVVIAHASTTIPGPVVETDWLAQNQDKVVILDVRKDVKSFTKQPLYYKDKKTGKQKLGRVGGHIPGAQLVNYKKVRATKMIEGKKVTRMVPTPEDFQALMQRVGLNQNDPVVIVTKGESNGDMTMATRFYWSLKYFGHTNLAILNGGMAQWILDKREVSVDASKPKKGNWTAKAPDNKIFASSEEVAAAVKAKDRQLVDTRPVSLYLGTWYKKSYVYDSGHIPGAKNYPNELITDPGLPARFISDKDTKALMSRLGIDPDAKSITYCNSGHLASGSWFLMSEILGNKDVKLYDGSMHQWTLEKRPTESPLKD
ncbi:MAG: sulfurtransferase [Thioalkalispiraceae bacterium]|jgi:thiosulfate/3-mercaptopyruvate sulfurtransferase